MTDIFIVDKDGNEANASDVTIPDNRFFRGAWVLSGNIISEDLSIAKEILRDKIRDVRKPLLEAKDVEIMKALETGADTSAIAMQKQALRDAPAASAIDAATDIEGLKASWDAGLLGENPYA